jgi:hypothetical protein
MSPSCKNLFGRLASKNSRGLIERLPPPDEDWPSTKSKSSSSNISNWPCFTMNNSCFFFNKLKNIGGGIKVKDQIPEGIPNWLADTCAPTIADEMAPTVVKLLWHYSWHIIKHKINYKMTLKSIG